MKSQLLNKRHLHFPSARRRVNPLPAALDWSFDCHLGIPRFHLSEHALRAGVDFFSTPEIKQ
jgi:hypothetical protein